MSLLGTAWLIDKKKASCLDEIRTRMIDMKQCNEIPKSIKVNIEFYEALLDETREMLKYPADGKGEQVMGLELEVCKELPYFIDFMIEE